MSSETNAAAPFATAEEAPSTAAGNPVVEADPQQLENIEEIDFLLEEIESKIAPLALA